MYGRWRTENLAHHEPVTTQVSVWRTFPPCHSPPRGATGTYWVFSFGCFPSSFLGDAFLGKKVACALILSILPQASCCWPLSAGSFLPVWGWPVRCALFSSIPGSDQWIPHSCGCLHCLYAVPCPRGAKSPSLRSHQPVDFQIVCNHQKKEQLMSNDRRNVE